MSEVNLNLIEIRFLNLIEIRVYTEFYMQSMCSINSLKVHANYIITNL